MLLMLFWPKNVNQILPELAWNLAQNNWKKISTARHRIAILNSFIFAVGTFEHFNEIDSFKIKIGWIGPE